MRLVIKNIETEHEDYFEFDNNWQLTTDFCYGPNSNIHMLTFFSSTIKSIFEVPELQNFFITVQEYLIDDAIQSKIQYLVYDDNNILIFDNMTLNCLFKNIAIEENEKIDFFTKGIKLHLYFYMPIENNS